MWSIFHLPLPNVLLGRIRDVDRSSVRELDAQGNYGCDDNDDGDDDGDSATAIFMSTNRNSSVCPV